MLFSFANNTVLSCFVFFFLIIDLYFLILEVIPAQIFIPIAELVICLGIPSKEAKLEIKIHTVTAEAKITKRSI